MKTTYLINKKLPDGNIRLSVATSTEWLAVVEANKRLPADQRRYFILDYIADGDDLDCIIMEAPFKDYQIWNKERLAERRNRRAGKDFQHISLNAPPAGQIDSVCLLELIASGEQVESAACDLILLDELRAALSTWKPWANDLLDMYLCGQKRTCTDAMAQKYSVSPQVVRKYKRQFEEFIKKFLGGVSF